MRPPAMERWYTALWDPGGGIILSVDGGFSGEADRAMSVMRLSGLFPRETSQVGMLACTFGDCREAQHPCCSVAGVLTGKAQEIYICFSCAFFVFYIIIC